MMKPWTIADRGRLALLLGAFCGLIASRADGIERMAPERLAALVEQFAGVPAMVDPRLILPDCADPATGWAVPGRSVAVVCGTPAWRIFIPVAGIVPTPRPTASAATPVAQPAVRRGDRVMVEAGGAGFRVGVAAIADSDARDGRVTLRNLATGVRIAASVAADGRVAVAALTPMVNRR